MTDSIKTKSNNSDIELKIAFCIQELTVIKNLLAIIDLDFYARVISRQIIIRTQDFILLARKYNNQSNFSTTEKQNSKGKINNLNTRFESVLKIKRDKLGAHMQDLDFFDRITEWQEINYDELLSLYSETQAICESLNVNANVDFLTLPSVDIKNIKTLLEEKNIEDIPRLGNDVFAITRQNQSGCLIPSHSIQEKISILNGIRLILDFEISLYKILTHNDYKLALRMLITNDIISFIDNIFNRDTQRCKGLNLILQEQEDKEAKNAYKELKNFLKLINLNELKNIRKIRNNIASHIDKKSNLKILMCLINKFNFDITLRIYSDILSILLKTCRSVFYLKHLMLSPVPINGALQNASKNEKPFFENDKNTVTKNEYINKLYLYDKKLNSLLNDKNLQNDEFYEKVRLFFYGELLHSDITKTSLLDGKKIEVRKASEFFIEFLNNNNNIKIKRIVLRVLLGCHGDPQQVVYVLLNSYKSNKKTLQNEYIDCFGNILDRHNKGVFTLLKNLSNTNEFNARYIATISLMKIDIKDRGIKCINSNLIIIENDYSKTIMDSISKVSVLYKVIISTLLVAEFIFGNWVSIYDKCFKELYLEYLQNVFNKNIKILRKEIKLSNNDIKNLKNSIQNNHFSNIFITLAQRSIKYEKIFYELIAVNMLKLNFQHSHFIEHYAYANYKIGNIDEAINTCQTLVDKNINNIDYKINLLNYRFEKGEFSEIQEEIDYIKKVYKITSEQIEKITDIQHAIQSKVNTVGI
jgi:hypothetical protein